MLILGIETSCDETSISVVKVNRGKFKVLSNVVSSQIKIHAKYGGVVPEVAARKHIENIMPVLISSFKKAKIQKKNVDVIAVTNGPGLSTSLLVGVETARTLSFALNKKLVAVNHIEAHILSNCISNPNIMALRDTARRVEFPALCLVVSGGHTQLVLVKGFGRYQIIGETVDDAVGECFDKVAKILGLGYPGGPIISRIAEKGNPEAYNLPRPMMKSKNFNFSFSGLKTAVLYLVKNFKGERIGRKLALSEVEGKKKIKKLKPKIIADIAASFEQAAVDVLIQKTIRAAEKYKVRMVMLAGGVSANKKLREELKSFVPVKCVLPDLEYTTDNAAMVAVAGYYGAKEKRFVDWDKIDIDPNLRL